jgi:hypothetical protein
VVSDAKLQWYHLIAQWKSQARKSSNQTLNHQLTMAECITESVSPSRIKCLPGIQMRLEFWNLPENDKGFRMEIVDF